jgi:tRNA 2-thiouridine synthesizing protein B
LSIFEIQHRDRGNLERDVFLLTKPPGSKRAKLCFQLLERSKNAALYLAGDGVFNLLSCSVEMLLQYHIYVCKEDMDARGMRPEKAEIQIVDFYGQLVEDMMERSDRIYSF